MLRSKFGPCLLTLSLAAVLTAAETDATLATSTLADAPLSGKSQTTDHKKAVANKMAPVAGSMSTLRARAKAVTESIGKLASNGELPTSQESVDQLKQMVQELTKINEQLQKLQEEVEGIQGWIEGQNESQPVLINDVETLKKIKLGGYVQFQANDIQNNPSNRRPNDGFNVRRARLSLTGQIDSKTSAKVSFDMSAGNRRTAGELRDLQLKYDIEPSNEKVGLTLLAGQQPIPLGYELERSSSDREFPERAQYNQRLFAGERGRGVYLKYGLSENIYVHGGIWNSLTVNDPQQTELDTFRNLSGTRPAGHAGIRYHDNRLDMGLSGFVGTRNDITFTPTGGAAITTPTGQRQFIYLDATYVGFLTPELTLRGEAMFGKDRVPQFTGSGAARTTSLKFATMRGYQLQASYNFNYRNSLSARYEMFDPNLNVNDNFSAWGLAFSHKLNPNAKVTLAHEWLKEQGGPDVPNNITTLRIQFKF